MKRSNRSIEVFDISLMAVVTKAMGAFLVLMLLLMPYYSSGPLGEKTIADLNEQVDQIDKDLKDMIEKAERVGPSVEDLRKLVAELRERLQKARALIQTLKRELDALNAQVKRLEDENRTLAQQLDGLRKQLAELQQEVARLRQENEQLQKTVADLKAENQRLRELFDPDEATLVAVLNSTCDLEIGGLGQTGVIFSLANKRTEAVSLNSSAPSVGRINRWKTGHGFVSVLLDPYMSVGDSLMLFALSRDRSNPLPERTFNLMSSPTACNFSLASDISANGTGKRWTMEGSYYEMPRGQYGMLLGDLTFQKDDVTWADPSEKSQATFKRLIDAAKKIESRPEPQDPDTGLKSVDRELKDKAARDRPAQEPGPSQGGRAQ